MATVDKYKVVKRKIVWSLENFQKQAFDKCKEEGIFSENFTIFLRGNQTEWCFSVYPSTENVNFCEFYIYKAYSHADDFVVKLKVSIQQSDDKLKNIYDLERKANEFETGFGWGCPNFIKIDDLFKVDNKYLTNDCLTFIIDFELIMEIKDVKQNPFMLSIGNYFNSKVFSDFTLSSNDNQKYPVHRCIIAARSKVLDDILNKQMAVNKSKVLKIEDVDGETLKEMLRFIYTGKVENLDTIASKLLYAADKYQLPELKSICADNLIKKLSIENVFEHIKLSDECKEEDLMEKCIKLIKSNYNVLRKNAEWKKLDQDLLMKIMDSIKNDNIAINIILKNTL